MKQRMWALYSEAGVAVAMLNNERTANWLSAMLAGATGTDQMPVEEVLVSVVCTRSVL